MIVVSGASGFVGRRLVPRLLEQFPATDLRCLVKDNDDHFGEQGTAILHSLTAPRSRQPADKPQMSADGRGSATLHRPAAN
jgi:thioester reductase-like protein